MRDYILRKLTELRQEKARLNSPYLAPADLDGDRTLAAQIALLEDIINADFRSYRIAMLKEVQKNWDMGFLTPEEFEAQKKEINEARPAGY